MAPAFLGDTWEWNGTAWTQRFPATSPPARRHHALANDLVRSRVVLFGGQGVGGAVLGDTWEWDGSNWAQRNPANAPSARFQHRLAYDSFRARTVLYGGTTNPTETWEWNGTTWTLRANTGPGSRSQFGMAFDASRNRVVLFGSGPGLPADTWEWNGAQWLQRAPLGAPPGRYYDALAYDSARGQMVLFGGLDGTGASIPGTWEYCGACDPVGPGQASGSLPIGCTSKPYLGQQFCVTFPSAQGFAALQYSPGTCNLPPSPLSVPGLCSAIQVYLNQAFVGTLTAPGNPATVCLVLPNTPSFVDWGLCMQGFALVAGPCFASTDGLSLRLLR